MAIKKHKASEDDSVMAVSNLLYPQLLYLFLKDTIDQQQQYRLQA